MNQFIADEGQVAMGTQGVYAWVDRNGLVAAFVVNPTTIPQTPPPCVVDFVEGEGKPTEPSPLPGKRSRTKPRGRSGDACALPYPSHALMRIR